ncbi:hypothetical protein C5167_001366 [Papaver somniferum]|uniref:Helicase C-terminal domain-containing protein n=1 Tax=Papaver somniferum TaxID=3469 RepID=A0A4Y7KSX3_PAPSO|nr:hypothetical protein C5167_001366 [Papaver somniferum]
MHTSLGTYDFIILSAHEDVLIDEGRKVTGQKAGRCVTSSKLRLKVVDSKLDQLAEHKMKRSNQITKVNTLPEGFKGSHKRILVATDLVGRGIDIERVNFVINYNMTDSADTYLHGVSSINTYVR